LAKRIPKARKGPDEVENRRKDLTRRCLIKSVDFLCKHEEEYAQTVWNMLEATMISTKTAGISAHMFPDAPKSIEKMPKMWKAQFLVDLGEGRLSMDTLKQLDAADENLIADVFNMFVKSQGTESLPAEAQDRRVLAIVMEERVKQVGGETVSAWAQRAIAL
jgi:hypothetical protein